MAFKLYIVLSALAAVSLAQRGSYAFRPVGYPEPPTTTSTTPSPDEIQNKFGEDSGSTPSTTTMRLPVQVLGDRALMDYLSKLPVDKQPFWFINWRALEEHANKPHSYQQRPVGFGDPTRVNNFQMWW